MNDRTLTLYTLEMEKLSQRGESTLLEFRSFCMKHEQGSILRLLIPVEYNRLAVSDTVSIDEPAGVYMEMVECRNSARGHLIATRRKYKAHGTMKRQKVCGTLL